MNRSNRELGRTGMVSDGGAPRCPACGLRLRFGTDRQGRATETCTCGYHAYVQTRGGGSDPGSPAPTPKV